MRIVGQRLRLTAEHLEWMRLPERFWDTSFAQIDPDLQPVIESYLRKIDDHLDKGEGLMLWGKNGTGKTSAATVVAKEVRRRGASVLYVTAERLRQSVLEKEMFDGDQLLVDRARRVDFLLLDDLGKEHSGSTGFSERLFEDLVRERSSQKRAIFLTTNQDTKEMVDHYKVSMIEVLKETVVPVRVQGPNRRNDAQVEMRKGYSAE